MIRHVVMFRWNDDVTDAQIDAARGMVRTFEKALLSEMGYALILTTDIQGETIHPARSYTYVIDQGPCRL